MEEKEYYITVKSKDKMFIKVLLDHAMEMIAEEYEENGNNALGGSISTDKETQKYMESLMENPEEE